MRRRHAWLWVLGLAVLGGPALAEADWMEGWTYRRPIRIDRSRVGGTLKDFPTLVCLHGEALRDETRGGHVAQSAGQDILFTAADGTTRLPHEIEAYSPDEGDLRAWVRVPALSGETDTTVYLYYGNASCDDASDPAAVWGPKSRLVLHQPSAPETAPNSQDLALSQELTVEAWVRAKRPSAEALQAVVAKWRPREAFDTFAAHDAGETSGLDTTGFLGAVFDGRYVYFVPQHDKKERHGKHLRYDTHKPLDDPSAWTGYDASDTSGLETKGYYGAVFDGRYVYYVPRRTNKEYHSRVLRYDTRGAFTNSSSWRAHDAGLPISYQGGAFDGRYVYFAPGYETGKGVCGKVLRYDTRGDFDDPASYAIHDASGTDGLDTQCFDGAVFDGRYVYFAPLDRRAVLRYDTQRPFAEEASWSGYDGTYLKMGRCVGAIFDGRYVYFVPYGDCSVVVRCDTTRDFRNAKSWQAYDADNTGGLYTKGFDGAAFDGRYVYFVPFYDGKDLIHGNALRYDTRGGFADPKSWVAYDASQTSGLLSKGYNGGAFDGRYLYMAPWHDGMAYPKSIVGHGRVLRYDTLGADGSFSLLYADCGHNGGLCGSVPGPRFIVNTTGGARSVAAWRILAPGRHYLAGVYDGKTITLYVDGEAARSREAGGPLQKNRVPVTIGELDGGGGVFDGAIEQVRVSDTARNADWIRTAYANQSAPEAFLHLGAEEKR